MIRICSGVKRIPFKDADAFKTVNLIRHPASPLADAYGGHWQHADDPLRSTLASAGCLSTSLTFLRRRSTGMGASSPRRPTHRIRHESMANYTHRLFWFPRQKYLNLRTERRWRSNDPNGTNLSGRKALNGNGCFSCRFRIIN